MRYEPLHDRIIVKAIDEKQETSGGLFIPDIARDSKHVGYGEVLAAGEGRVNMEGKTVPLRVKAGDVIAFPRKAAALLPIINADGKEEIVLLLREAECVAIVHDLPRDTGLTDLEGKRILAMVPSSRGIPDSAYQNREELEIARREGWDQADVVDDAEVGEAPP